MNSKPRIAIFVSAAYGPEHPHQDDALLRQALESHNCDADIVVWDDPSADCAAYDAGIIRSCWDYDRRVEAFLERMTQVSRTLRLFNPIELIRANSDKRYLLDLERRGICTVPTVFVEAPSTREGLSERPALPALPGEWDQVIVKPTVSASGRDTYKYAGHRRDAIQEACAAIFEKGKQPMLQRYFETVEHFGEHSSVIIDGHITFTMKKTPAENNYLVHQHLGGTYAAQQTSDAEVLFLRDLLSKLDDIPLYLRVDYLRDVAGNLYLLELEAIEPNLYLHQNPKGLELLVNGLLKRLAT